MSTSRALLVLVASALLWIGAPTSLRAGCAAPGAEPPVLVTPTDATVAPGDVVLFYLSTEARRDTFHLVSESTHARLPVTPRAITSFVYALEIPRQATPGRHAIEVTRAARAGSPYTPGTVVVGGTSSSRALPAPRGRFVLRESPGRWAPSVAAELVLDAPAPTDVGVVFRWTDAHGEHGNAAWLLSGRVASATASGHCGTYPFGTVVPAPGAQIDVAFVDARGALGPWATLTVAR